MLVPVLLALFCFSVRMQAGVPTNDDAFITFRYARNVAMGLGFVYNAGQHVIGTTTPLYTLILAVLYRIGLHDLPLVARTVNALADAVTAILLYAIGRTVGWSEAWSALGAVLFSLCAVTLHYSTSGMDVSVFAMLIVASIVADMRGREEIAGVLVGCAILARPEGLLLAALILLRRSWLLRGVPVRFVLAVAAVILPWIIYVTSWAGTPIPGSIAAKSAAYAAPVWGMAGELIHALCSPGLNLDYIPSPYPALYFDAQMGFLFVSVCVTFTAIFRWKWFVEMFRIHPERLPLFWFAPLLVTLYAVSGLRHVDMFSWYVVVLTPFYVLAGVAVARILTRALWGAGVLATLAFCLWTLAGLTVVSAGHTPRVVARATLNPHEIAYRAAATYLKPYVHPNDLVALKEFGAFGYYANTRVLDIDGIISPEARKYYPLTGANEVPLNLLREDDPAWIVNLDIFTPRTLLTNPWFKHTYYLMHTIRVDPSDGGHWVLIYRRRV
jgi:hypothetical protein